MSISTTDAVPPVHEQARSTIDAAAAGILDRLERLPDLAEVEVMSPLAALHPSTVTLIQGALVAGRRKLRRQVCEFRDWLDGPGSRHPASYAQRRFALLRLRWIAVLAEYDIYADALSQRSERPIGVWLAGLDHLASDALVDGLPIDRRPDVVCHLDRGAGGAIRRARTRLPAGSQNPVPIIRVPRERMIGPGIGSSVVHEVGHQVAALLCLVESLRADFSARAAATQGSERRGWQIYTRWVSEMVADFWSVGLLGIASTAGLIEVVSLPSPFVFRVSMTDPHPAPWIRVRLSARIGARLHPDPAWNRITAEWETRYPPYVLAPSHRNVIDVLDALIDEVATALAEHSNPALDGQTLADLVPAGDRRPSHMRVLARTASDTAKPLGQLRPTEALAAIGALAAEGATGVGLDERVDRLLADWARIRYRDGGRP